MAKHKTIRITCETKDYLPFDQLQVFQGELKKRTDEDYRKITESILKHGFAAPFFVWKDKGNNRLLDGTGRYEALERLLLLGYTLPDLPVVYVQAKNEAEARELLLKITSRYGKVSSKGLEQFLKGLQIDFDGLDLGVFIKRDLPQSLGAVPEAAPQPATKPGDMYEFYDDAGEVRHRLLCADATQEESFAELMGHQLAAMLFTDPPYGVNIGEKIRDMKRGANKGNAQRQAAGSTDDIQGDSLSPHRLRQLWADALKCSSRRMREDAAFYVCGGSFPRLIQAQLNAFYDAGLEPKHLLVWCKNQAIFSMNRTDYDYQHELIWYGWKSKHRFYGLGKFKTSLWNFNKPQKSNLHPTMKPPALIEEAIKNSMEPVEKRVNGIINGTGKNDIVLDPFAGSGSTMAACENLKRRAFMLEIEPRYCDVIVLRGMDINPALAVYRIRGGEQQRVEAADMGRK